MFLNPGSADYERLINCTLKHVPFDGWSMVALENGANDADISKEDAMRAFDFEPNKLVEGYSNMLDDHMLKDLEEYDFANMRVRDRIHTCVMVRLKLLAKHKDAAIKTAVLLSIPANAALGCKLINQTVDKMWRASGDTATDFNYYSKRALLSGVYTSTLLYWFNDVSEDFQETSQFLERRIENVMSIPKVKGSIMSTLEMFSLPFRNFFKKN